jgi:hypothetical protein
MTRRRAGMKQAAAWLTAFTFVAPTQALGSVSASAPPVRAGATAALTARVFAATTGTQRCEAYVPTPSIDDLGSLRHLAPRRAHAGRVRFTWRLSPRSAEGSWPFVVTCGAAGSTSGTVDIRPRQLPDGTRAQPIALQREVDRQGWRISVQSATPDATAQVLAANPFNAPPAPGRQFFIVRVRATRVDAQQDDYSASFNVRAVGASNVGYTSFDDSCGVIPDAFPDTTDVFEGGTVEGNVCFSILSTDAASLVAYEHDSSTDPEDLFFAVR